MRDNNKNLHWQLLIAGFQLSLSSRNRAIADYLRSNGYEEAYSTFKKEAELDMVRRGDICWLKGVLSVSYCLSFPPRF